ncbi:MAG: type II toxin-antitoxin system VapC family toxin [Acidimicrobiales bacterium]|jgi:predicted nucleic acid-binding protein
MRPGLGVLDTSVVILLDQLAADADLPEQPLITTVTLAELSVGPLVTDDDSERAVRLARLQVTEATFEPIPFDAPAARAFGRIAAALRGSGRRPKARSFDAIIAATALSRNLPIFTANPEDFNGIEGLEVVPIRAN